MALRLSKALQRRIVKLLRANQNNASEVVRQLRQGDEPVKVSRGQIQRVADAAGIVLSVGRPKGYRLPPDAPRQRQGGRPKGIAPDNPHRHRALELRLCGLSFAEAAEVMGDESGRTFTRTGVHMLTKDTDLSEAMAATDDKK